MTNSKIGLVLLFCIFPLTYNQKGAEWPWSKAIVGYTGFTRQYPKNHFPNLATVVLHDDKAYSPLGWEWDKKDWIRTLTGIIGEKIMVGWRKVEGLLYEKASLVTVSGNLLDPNLTTRIHPGISAKLCHTAGWECDKQKSLIMCCRQKHIGNYTTLDPSTNNVKMSKSFKNDKTHCWYNLTLTRPVYVVCSWQSNLANRSDLLSLTFKFKINAVTKTPVMLVAIVTHHGMDTTLTLNDKKKVLPPFMVAQGDNISIRCRLITDPLLCQETAMELKPMVLFCHVKTKAKSVG